MRPFRGPHSFAFESGPPRPAGPKMSVPPSQESFRAMKTFTKMSQELQKFLEAQATF
jgi:hypothetical protein